jgi:hypothetical protein
MKKKLRLVKTLVLSRETLRNLEARQLANAVGGHSLPPRQCGDSNNTCDNCPTYSCGLFQCL